MIRTLTLAASRLELGTTFRMQQKRRAMVTGARYNRGLTGRIFFKLSGSAVHPGGRADGHRFSGVKGSRANLREHSANGVAGEGSRAGAVCRASTSQGHLKQLARQANARLTWVARDGRVLARLRKRCRANGESQQPAGTDHSLSRPRWLDHSAQPHHGCQLLVRRGIRRKAERYGWRFRCRRLPQQVNAIRAKVLGPPRWPFFPLC